MKRVPLTFFNNSNVRRWWFEIGFDVKIMNTNTKQSAKLSPEMAQAVEFMRTNGGKLARYQGGFWMKPGLTGAQAIGSSAMRGSVYFGTPTVRGLVKRGLATETHGARMRLAYL